MWNIFSYALLICHLSIIFNEAPVKIFDPFFTQVFFPVVFLNVKCLRVLRIFQTTVLHQLCLLQIFPPVCDLYSHSLDIVCAEQKILLLVKSSLCYFFQGLCLWCFIQTVIIIPQVIQVFSYVILLEFVVLHFIFMLIIYFELIL